MLLPATSPIASAMLEWAPQRQMLPLMRSRISYRQFWLKREVDGHMARDARLDLVEHRYRRADLPGRAVAALETVVFDKSRLHRDEATGLTDPSMVVTLSPSCMTASVRHELMRTLFDDDGAGPALAMVASFLRAGQMKVLAQRVEERGTSIELKAARLSIHLKRDTALLRFLICRLGLRLCARHDADHGCRRPGGEQAPPRNLQVVFWHVFIAPFRGLGGIAGRFRVRTIREMHVSSCARFGCVDECFSPTLASGTCTPCGARQEVQRQKGWQR